MNHLNDTDKLYLVDVHAVPRFYPTSFFAIIWILITLNLLHMFLKCYIAVNHVLTTVYFMLQTCLDFYSSILVETPEYANPGNEIQLETTNESYTSPIAEDDQPTYQGLLNDNSEFLSMIISSCASYN